MPLWKLTPIDPTDQNWRSSSHCGPVIVRAPNEIIARAQAAEAFDVPVGFRPGEGVPFPPWTRAALVRAERIDDPRFAAEGPTELLEPVL